MKVALFSEQLFQDVPGGIGAYVRALLDYLPGAGIAAEPVVALHRVSELADAGLPQARRLRTPRAALYRSWERGAGSGLGGDADLVHAPSLAFPKRDARPLVVTVHDLLFREYPDAYPKRGVAFHDRMVSRLGDADAIIAVSHHAAEGVRELGYDNVHVVRNGTDFERPTDEARDQILDSLDIKRPYVLWNGTVEPRKNPEGVVHGFVNALESGVPNAETLRLYLAGPPGWWSGDLGEFLRSKDMTERVLRLGEQPKHVREALHAGAEAFLFPSLAEGFGLPVLEAMACGAPVVTSNRSALPEVAGAAALLCDPDDESSIGSSLAKILRDPELAEDLRRLGFARAKEFTWQRSALETADVYRSVLSGGQFDHEPQPESEPELPDPEPELGNDADRPGS